MCGVVPLRRIHRRTFYTVARRWESCTENERATAAVQVPRGVAIVFEIRPLRCIKPRFFFSSVCVFKTTTGYHARLPLATTI